MFQQTLSLRLITANEPEMLANTFQMLEACLFVLRIVVRSNGQQAQLGGDPFYYGQGNVACIGQEIAVAAEGTELNRES